jgi:hypothetical protein
MSFIKNKEDFVCENCGFNNLGNGYTNHCSKCLYSKHVDNDPGDRLNACSGLMGPIYVSYTNKDMHVIHKCVVCNFEKRNILNQDDSVEAMIGIQKKSADRK